MRISVSPAKADAPLVINANAVLPLAITGQFFQAIPWRGTKILKSLGGVYQEKLAKGYSLKARREPR
jgi:hypothetical protein